MKLHILAFACMGAVGLVSWVGCGGVAYVGDLPQQRDGGGSDPSDAQPGVPTPGTDAGRDTPPSAEGGVTQCAGWGGTCQAAGSSCESTKTSSAGHGCSSSEICCMPRCFPAGGGCPPGMGPSPTADAICGADIHCVPLPPSECSNNGGTCTYDDGTGLTDVCTGSGLTLGKFACPGVKLLCCLPK